MNESRELILNARSHRELVNEFIDSIDNERVSKKSYGSLLRIYVDYLEQKGIDKPNEKDVVAFKNDYLKIKKKLMGSSIQKYIVVLKKFYQWCYRRKFYEDVSIDLTYERIESDFTREPLTLAQVHKLLLKAKRLSSQSVSNYRDFAIVMLIVMTGLRTIEVARADVTDIKDGYLFIQGKRHSSKDQRVELPLSVKEVLDEYLLMRNSSAEALFISHSNRNPEERITTQVISKRIKELLRSIDLDDPRYSAHGLRHTFATLALKSGVSVEEVQMILRHKNINTTMIYLHNLSREDNHTESIVESKIMGSDNFSKRMKGKNHGK